MYGVHIFLSPSLINTMAEPDSSVPHSVPMTAPNMSHLERSTVGGECTEARYV